MSRATRRCDRWRVTGAEVRTVEWGEGRVSLLRDGEVFAILEFKDGPRPSAGLVQSVPPSVRARQDADEWVRRGVLPGSNPGRLVVREEEGS